MITATILPSTVEQLVYCGLIFRSLKNLLAAVYVLNCETEKEIVAFKEQVPE